MKKINSLSILFVITLFIPSISHAMENMRPGDNFIIDQLSYGQNQGDVLRGINKRIETIKLIINCNKTTRLENLIEGLGYSLSEIEIACNEMKNAPKHLIEEIQKAKEKERKEEICVQQIQQSIIENQNPNPLSINIEQQILQARAYNQDFPTIITNLLLLECSKEAINQAFKNLNIPLDQFQSNNIQDIIEENDSNEIIEDPEIKEIKEEEREEEEGEEIEEEEEEKTREEKEKKRRNNIIVLMQLLKAMKNKTFILLPCIHYEDPKDQNLQKLLAAGFKKEDIITACEKLGLENVDEELKKELKLKEKLNL